MRKNFVMFLAVFLMVVFTSGIALAQTNASVSWVSPENLSRFCVGTKVTTTGQASGSGQIGGTGLDLMFVIDRSGSMSGSGIAAAKSATNSLIDSLPTATTQAGLASFASSATLNQQLLPLVPASNIATLKSAVNSLNASGGTMIGAGIDAATGELTSSRAIAGHAKMQVVLSDGVSSGTPAVDAAEAYAQGITVHAVGVPGHNAAQMQAIAAAGHGTYTNVTNLADLEAIFDGTGGNLVGLDYLDILLPDSTLLHDYATDGLGNFVLPDWTMQLGDNIFTATAYATDGSFASAQLNLIGTVCPTPIPGSLILLGSGIFALFGLRKKLHG